ncbi:unnamed protein product [Malus baccata var. baccata]
MVATRLMDINIGNGFCTSVELDVPCANAGQDKPCLDRCTSKFPGSNGNKDQSQCGYVLGQVATNPGGKQRQEDQEGEVGERVGDKELEPE